MSATRRDGASGLLHTLKAERERRPANVLDEAEDEDDEALCAGSGGALSGGAPNASRSTPARGDARTNRAALLLLRRQEMANHPEPPKPILPSGFRDTDLELKTRLDKDKTYKE